MPRYKLPLYVHLLCIVRQYNDAATIVRIVFADSANFVGSRLKSLKESGTEAWNNAVERFAELLCDR